MRTTSFISIAIAIAACGGAPTPSTDASATPPAAVANPDVEAKTAKPPKPKPTPKTRTYDDEIADADLRIAGSRKLAEDQPTSYLAADRVANTFLSRARLTGDYADYREAEVWTDKAFAINAPRVVEGADGVAAPAARALRSRARSLRRCEEALPRHRRILPKPSWAPIDLRRIIQAHRDDRVVRFVNTG